MQDAKSWVNALAGANQARTPMPAATQQAPAQPAGGFGQMVNGSAVPQTKSPFLGGKTSLFQGGPNPFKGGNTFGNFTQSVNPKYLLALQQAQQRGGPPQAFGETAAPVDPRQMQAAVRGIPQYVGYGQKPANAAALEAQWAQILNPVVSTAPAPDTSNYYG